MLKTFSIGGVHPHENKLSAHQPIIKAEVPAKAVILLGQHIGALQNHLWLKEMW